MLVVKLFVCPHQRDQILSVAAVDYVVGVAGQHVNGLYIVARNLKVEYFVRADLALLYQRPSAYDNEELPLGVMPMLAFCNAGP